MGAETTLGKIIALMRTAERAKPPVARLPERYAGHYLALVLMIAAGMWLASGDTAATLAVLVASCPRALVLAAPAPATAISVAARHALPDQAGGCRAAATVGDRHCWGGACGDLSGAPGSAMLVVQEGDVLGDERIAGIDARGVQLDGPAGKRLVTPGEDALTRAALAPVLSLPPLIDPYRRERETENDQ